MDRSNSQYDSFLFWRQPIPELDPSELEDLGLEDPGLAAGPPASARRQEDEDFLSDFTSFTFWRAPLADVDSLLADLNLLL